MRYYKMKSILMIPWKSLLQGGHQRAWHQAYQTSLWQAGFKLKLLIYNKQGLQLTND